VTLAREFHEAFGEPAPASPTVPSHDLAAFRMRLIGEEFKEVKEEFSKLLARLRLGHGPNDDKTVEIMQSLVKEVCDLCYVVEGTLLAYGVEDAYDEVHRSNMTKTPSEGGGKAIKGAGYTPADPEKMFPAIIEGTCYEEEA
jgi:predicted HAD superfamily Cof-like phosphohydrolase